MTQAVQTVPIQINPGGGGCAPGFPGYSGIIPYYVVFDGTANIFASAPFVDGAPVSLANGRPMPVQILPAPATPIAPSGSLSLAAGGASQPLATAGTVLHGCTINNPSTAAFQGIGAAESIVVNYTGGSASLTGGGQSIEVLPGGTMTLPALATAISWTAATTGHKINATVA